MCISQFLKIIVIINFEWCISDFIKSINLIWVNYMDYLNEIFVDL